MKIHRFPATLCFVRMHSSGRFNKDNNNNNDNDNDNNNVNNNNNNNTLEYFEIVTKNFNKD